MQPFWTVGPYGAPCSDSVAVVTPADKVFGSDSGVVGTGSGVGSLIAQRIQDHSSAV